MIPMVVLRITKEPDGPTRVDAIAHNVEAPTKSYSTSDDKTFYDCATGVVQDDPKIAGCLQALIASWNSDFSKDRFGNVV